ncbi:MAG: hypothetical protein P4L81_07035 [Candidatus Pacebacteria bacterium]|nr:hypothetical protein [Candidatus Paceibacterota bacterium]
MFTTVATTALNNDNNKETIQCDDPVATDGYSMACNSFGQCRTHATIVRDTRRAAHARRTAESATNVMRDDTSAQRAP